MTTSLNKKRARIAKKTGGMTTLQITIGLAVVALAIAGAIKGINKMEQAKANDELNELGDLKLQVAQYAASRGGDFTGVDTNLCANYFFDKASVSGTGASTKITNRWKGTVTCAPATTISTNDSLAFTYTGVPAYGCKRVMQMVKAEGVTIGGTSVKTFDTAMNESAAITQCDAGADSATIVYTFAR
ncbi:type 4 pilus major pilin [Cupriavidus basilensis]